MSLSTMLNCHVSDTITFLAFTTDNTGSYQTTTQYGIDGPFNGNSAVIQVIRLL